MQAGANHRRTLTRRRAGAVGGMRTDRSDLAVSPTPKVRRKVAKSERPPGAHDVVQPVGQHLRKFLHGPTSASVGAAAALLRRLLQRRETFSRSARTTRRETGMTDMSNWMVGRSSAIQAV